MAMEYSMAGAALRRQVLAQAEAVEASAEGAGWLSLRAQRRGYQTVDDLKRAVLGQRAHWWSGSAFHCALCDLDFISASRAAEHVVMEQHPVLRMD